MDRAKFEARRKIRSLSRIKIFKPPGAQWMRFARFFFSPESITEVFEPVYKDFWYEYEKAFVAVHK